MFGFGTQEPILAIGLGTTEIILICAVVVLLFGVSKLPQLGKGLGEGIRNFKTSIKEISADSEKKPSDSEKG